MGCEKRRNYQDNLETLIKELNNKEIKNINDLEFLRDIAVKFDPESMDFEKIKAHFEVEKVHTSKIGDKIKLPFKMIMKMLHKQNKRKEDRTHLLGLIHPTLDDPFIVVDMKDQKGTKKYYTPFIDPTDNLVHFMSVTADKGKGDYLISSFDADLNQLYTTFNNKDMEVVYMKRGGDEQPNSEAKANGATAAPSVKTIITDFQDRIKRAKDSNSKRDAVVDLLWDATMGVFDLGATPVKKGLGAMNKNIDPNASWFGVSELQKEVNLVVTDHRNITAGIYDAAATLKDHLGSLGKEQSKQLVRALNGDMAPQDLPGELMPLYGKFRSTIDKNADQLVELGVLDEKNKIEHYLKRYYKQYLEDGHRGSSLAYKKLKARKDLTQDERLALGMMEDADFVIPQTIAEQNILIEKAKTLKALADQFGSETEFPGAIQISNETVGAGVKKWGALAGKWVDPEVKKELDHARLVAEQFKYLEDGLYPVIDHLKVNMTVKNPVTHVYNIASNMLLSGLNGDMVALAKVLHMRSKDPAKFKALVKKANQYGLDSYLDDFERPEVVLSAEEGKANPIATIWKNLYMTADSKTGEAARHLYDWEDKIFKVAAFNKNLEKGMDEKTAYREAVDVYVDYSTPLPAGVRFLDKSGIMPFLHYQYKSTPAVAKVMAKHPLRTLIMGTGVAALGISSFQNDDEEYLTPEWANDKFNLFGVGEWIKVAPGWYLNAGRMIPGTKFEFEFGGFLRSFVEIINGETPLGYEIGKKYDSALEKYGKRVLTLMENFLPSLTLGRYSIRSAHIGLGEAGIVEPKKNYYDEDLTIAELALRAAGVRNFNEQKEAASKLRAAKNLKKHKDKVDPKDKKAHEEEYNNSARRINQAAKAAGVNLSVGNSSDKAFNVSFDLKDPKFD